MWKYSVNYQVLFRYSIGVTVGVAEKARDLDQNLDLEELTSLTSSIFYQLCGLSKI